MKKYVLFIAILLGSAVGGRAQVSWSVKAGGGASNLILFNKSDFEELFEESGFAQAGIILSGSFVKEGKISWQTGIALQTSGFRSIPIDVDEIRNQMTELPGGGGIHYIGFDDINKRPRDYDNLYRYRTIYINLPFSLVYRVFDPVSLLYGAEMNYSFRGFTAGDISKINPTGRTMQTKGRPNVAGHLGLSIPLFGKITLQGLIFSDLLTVIDFDYDDFDNRWQRGYRRAGFTLDVLYRLD